MAKSRQLLLLKSYIVDVRLGSKYASDLTPWLSGSYETFLQGEIKTQKIDSVLCVNTCILKKLGQRAILLIFLCMNTIYDFFIMKCKEIRFVI